MLTRGNSKLGKNIYAFSIPAGSTCPGKSELCNNACYAQSGFFHMPSVQDKLSKNLQASKRSDFVEKMIIEIRKVKAKVIRWHVAGDVYDVEYARKLHDIFKACQDVTFFIYSRSWRVLEIRKELVNIAKRCKNVKMWWSTDAETGAPPNIPSYIRCAYMAVNRDDIPPRHTDLVFRDYDLHGGVQKQLRGVMICPPENGRTDINCEQCGFCFRYCHSHPKKDVQPINSAINAQKIHNRTPLPLVA